MVSLLSDGFCEKAASEKKRRAVIENCFMIVYGACLIILQNEVRLQG